MLLHSKIRDIADGETLELLSTDPSSARDVPKFCSFLGHELLEQHEREGCYHYLLRKQEQD